MEFIVTGRDIDGLPIPPKEALGAYQATFEMLARGDNAAMRSAWPHAGERAPTFLMEADTAEALADTLNAMPGFMLSSWTAHPVSTPGHVAASLRKMQAAPGQ